MVALALHQHLFYNLPNASGAEIKPRQWQQQLIQLLRRRLERGKPSERDVLVFAGPGAGKTLGALLAFKAMQQEQRLQHHGVCHRTSILSQWQSALPRPGLRLQEWPCDAAAAEAAMAC